MPQLIVAFSQRGFGSATDTEKHIIDVSNRGGALMNIEIANRLVDLRKKKRIFPR
jgi:hypothetical protein